MSRTEQKSKRRKISTEFQDEKEDLEAKFEVKFNTDIFWLWKWALKSKNPLECFREKLGLKLCGPFRILDETSPRDTDDVVDLHMLDREWQCPPEVQPCVITDTHVYGLWRDNPLDTPCFVVSKQKNSGVLTPYATDLLNFVRVYAKSKRVELPEELNMIIDTHANSESLKLLDSKRKKGVVAKTFNKIGIVVPVSKNNVGYRALSLSYGELSAILTKSCGEENVDKKDDILAPFDECVSYIQFANDECDYGMGMEFGMCLFSHQTSKNFIGTISRVLCLAYELLGRPLYSQIVKRMCETVDKPSESD